MTSLDTAIRPVASTVINQFGTTVEHKGGVFQKYDTTTGVVSKSTEAVSRKCIVEQSKGTRQGSSDNKIDSIAGVKNELKLIMASHGESFAPQVGHTIILNGKTYNVTDVVEQYSGDLVATYEVMIKL